ncbi:rabankyrin-5 isoform X2 [Oratosquilla oratoria]|uniref:rabankyrin-5 isoform X2 n=1 Tax=Oratosquilla oratoria TaxID=337810 RepID=UPI003F75BDA9
MAKDGEVFKLQQHMSLLRDEYVRLQDRYNKLEQQYAIATAAAGDKGDESFLARLLCFVADLYDKEVYSDMTVRLKERQIRVHRFVLAARSDHWGVDSLATADTLDWSNLEQEVGETLLKWVYTDRISLPNDDDTFTLGLLRAAAGFKLQALMKRCEKSLMGTVTVRSCVKLYTTADEIGAETLRDHCSTLIATHWNDFTPEDFEHMTAPLLYAMFKTKTDHPLHSAVRLHREDVVFLFLMEFDAQHPIGSDMILNGRMSFSSLFDKTETKKGTPTVELMAGRAS